LNGEGLQHQDGHSHLLALSVPTLLAYDPAFAYEIAVIIREGIDRMYRRKEDGFYYLTLQNENYSMPPMPSGAEDGILKGLYKFKRGPENLPVRAHIFGSGAIIREALRAQEILAEDYGVSADVWSATSYKKLRTDAILAERYNLLHPDAKPKIPYISKILTGEKGPFVAVSDYMKLIPEQVSQWVPGGLKALGTDGFGRSDTRENLRRFFEIDAPMITLAVLASLKERGLVDASMPGRAIKKMNIDPEKAYPELL